MSWHRVWTVFVKECVDNLRDRRTLLSALLFGPLFGPVMLVLLVNFAISMAVEDAEKPLHLPVAGAEHAPNLMRFLEQNNVKVRPAPEDPEAAVRAGEHPVVLIVPAAYAEDFSAGRPAVLELVQDSSDRHASKHVRRAERILEGYGRRIAALRLQVRGVNPLVMSPLVIRDRDIASAEARAVVLLGMLPYFIVFSALLGGFYLAIDTTAGERERNSLEPLLSTAATRAELVYGKLGATAAFCSLSLLVALLMLAAAIPFVPLAKLGMASSLDARTVSLMLASTLPFALLSAAMLSVVASFAKSFKEAQTWLSVVLFVPLAPGLLNMLYPLDPTLGLMAVPVLSQNILLLEFLKGAAVPTSHIALSATTTLIATAFLGWVAVKLYEREIVTG